MSLKNEEEKVSIFQSIYKYMYTDKAVQSDGRTKEHGVLNHQYGQSDSVWQDGRTKEHGVLNLQYGQSDSVRQDGRTKEHGVLNHQYGQNDNVDRREHKDKKEARFSLSSLSNGLT